MSYTLRFLPEVEEDAIAGYEWYEQKSQVLARNSYVLSMRALLRQPAALRNTRKCIRSSDAAYSADSLTLSTTGLEVGMSSCADCFTAHATPAA